MSFPRLVVERSSRGEQLRRRCAVFAAAGIFVGGLLAALGVALLVLGALEVVALIGAVVAARRDLSAALARRLTSAFERARAGPQRVAASDWPSSNGFSKVDDEEPTAESAARAPADAPDVMETEASRCHELGVRLRRSGRAQHAVVLHEAARLIFAGVGNARGEALAANGLAVALVEAGRQDSAWEQFEQARTILQSLGERQWEGKVLANAGLARRRLGQDQQARDLLRSALERLAPDTNEYQVVERRLKRAG